MSPDDTATTRRAFLAVTGATALAGCSGTLSSIDDTESTVETPTTDTATAAPDDDSPDWPQLGRNPGQNGYVPEFTAETEPAVAWKTTVDGSLTTPTVVDDTVYVTRGVPGENEPEATLEAYALESGERQWSRTLGVKFGYGAPFSNYRPVVYDGTIYVTTLDGITTLDAGTRDVRWQVTIEQFFNTPPTVTEDGIYGTAGKSVVALDHDGETRWQRNVEGRRRYGSVVASEGTVYSIFGRRLLAIDAASGELRWEHANDDGPSSDSPVVAQDSVVRASFEGVERVSSDGTRRWLADGPEEDLLRPVVGDGTVFAVGLYGTVTAYELSSGEQLWQTKVGDGEWTQETAPVLLNGTVVVPQSDGTEVSVHALDAASGDQRWSVSASDARIRGPVAASGHLVATSQDRHVNVRGTPESPPTGTIRVYEFEN